MARQRGARHNAERVSARSLSTKLPTSRVPAPPPASPSTSVDARTPRAPKTARSFKGRLKASLSALQRNTPFNPYWLEAHYLRRAVAELAPSASGWMLDIGVGERPYAEVFAPHVDRYVGVEYPAACNNLVPGIVDLITSEHGFIDVWCDGHALPFETGSFDTLLSIEVLEHIPNPQRMLAEMQRVLKPGGRLLVTVPFTAPQHALPHDFYRYTPQGIRALLEQAGFRVDEVRPRGNFAASTGTLVAQWLMRTFGTRAWHHDGSVSMSRWRAPLVIPFIALAQVFFRSMGALCKDDQLTCMGYAVVAHRPHDD